MTDAEKEELQEYRRQDLLRRMQTISQEHWDSSWNTGLEHDLYLMTFHGLVPDYGMGVIRPELLADMKRLAELCQVWWIQAGAHGQRATISLEEAERRFSKLIATDELGGVHTMSIPEAMQIGHAPAGDWDSETVSALFGGMSAWRAYRHCAHPMIMLVYRETEGDWELRFSDTTLSYVRPTWARTS